jgi:hypothetical protein
MKVTASLNGSSAVVSVLDVSTDFGMLKSPKFPLRFNLSIAGVAGDSGGFITEDQSALPVGLYLGAFTTSPGHYGQNVAFSSGVGLSTYQLERMMDMEIYQ